MNVRYSSEAERRLFEDINPYPIPPPIAPDPNPSRKTPAQLTRYAMAQLKKYRRQRRAANKAAKVDSSAANARASAAATSAQTDAAKRVLVPDVHKQNPNQ